MTFRLRNEIIIIISKIIIIIIMKVIKSSLHIFLSEDKSKKDMTRDESLTKVTTGEPFLQTEIETPRIRGGKQCGFGGVGGTEWREQQQKNNGQRHRLLWPRQSTDPAEISFIRL